ncbi:MAG: hypothetical protein JXR38_03090 [Bacilli bacterium]|nr:hypothetical protein [Bacilli bacterium]
MAYSEKHLKTLCINGDIAGVVEYLKQFPEKQALLRRYQKRFYEKPPYFTFKTKNLIARKILRVYYQYYIMMFVEKKTTDEGKEFLESTFNRLFHFSRFKNINQIEDHIKKLLKSEGFHFLGDQTSSFYGPYIWQTMYTRTYDVELPETRVKVKVNFMDGFISNSWMDFLSFGKIGTGGWTKPQGLFCKSDAYRKIMDKPGFKVSYLKHECQHLADYQRFGMILEPHEWEYRAKLTELIYYPTMKLFRSFLRSAKKDIRFTHSYAEYQLISDLSTRLFKEEYVSDPEKWQENFKKIGPVCRELLELSSKALEERKSLSKKEALN